MALNSSNKSSLDQELRQRKYAHTLEGIRAHIEEKHRYKNFNRYVNIQGKEQEEDYQRRRQREEAAFKEKNLHREIKLAREVDKMKREELKELKLRQLLRENSHELRDLERKLKAAYINKELASQIAQKEADRLNEKIQEKRTCEILKAALVTEGEYSKRLAIEEMNKKAYYKQELQDQIVLSEKSKRHAYEEFLREKKLIDDIVQRIHDEDERELAERMCKVKRTQQEIMAFKQAQELWKQKKREEIIEENRKIQEYLMSKAADVSSRQAEKARQEALREEMSDNIAKQLYEESRKKKERDDIVQDLLEEEQKEALDKRYREEVEKQIRQRIETRKSLLTQMAERRERDRQAVEEDAKYKDQLLAQLAEDEKLEQLSDQKKRMKMLQLRRDVEQMMVERRQKHAEEMQRLIAMEELDKLEAEQRRRLVEEERIRMLQDHVKNLVGYLPKGLLKEDDLPHLEVGVLKDIGIRYHAPKEKTLC